MTKPVITARQICAARGLIGWSQSELARAANISRSTIAAIEKGAGNPTFEMMAGIRAAFENKQVEFLTQEGVRFRAPTILYDDALGANRRAINDYYKVATEYNENTKINEILIYGLREDDAKLSVGDYLAEHIDRLQAAGIVEKILCTPDTETFIAPQAWYRRLPEAAVDKTMLPVIVYGEKLAVVQWQPKETVVIVDSKPIADSFRSMFRHIWNSHRVVKYDDV